MAKTSPRPKSGKAAGDGTSRSNKKPSPPWYQRYSWLPWVVGVGLVAIVLIALRSGGADAPAPGESVANPVVGGDLHSFVVSPDDPETLYIGSHQGVSVSSDGGATWEVIESLNAADAMGWGFTDDAILVGGHPGLNVSTDGGETFALRNEGLPSTDVHALGATGDTIYAGVAGAGLFVSTNGGSSWEAGSERFGGSFMGRIQVDPSDDQHLLAPDMQAGVVESTDGGRTWEPLGGVEGPMWVSWAPGNTQRVVATSQVGAVSSTDGGRSWEPLEVPQGASIVEFSPHDPEVLYAAVLQAPEAKVYVSRDGGESWKRP